MPFKSPSSRFVRRSDGALKSPLSCFVGQSAWSRTQIAPVMFRRSCFVAFRRSDSVGALIALHRPSSPEGAMVIRSSTR